LQRNFFFFIMKAHKVFFDTAQQIYTTQMPGPLLVILATSCVHLVNIIVIWNHIDQSTIYLGKNSKKELPFDVGTSSRLLRPRMNRFST
jgi:hypothetical protein